MAFAQQFFDRRVRKFQEVSAHARRGDVGIDDGAGLDRAERLGAVAPVEIGVADAAVLPGLLIQADRSGDFTGSGGPRGGRGA